MDTLIPLLRGHARGLVGCILEFFAARSASLYSSSFRRSISSCRSIGVSSRLTGLRINDLPVAAGAVIQDMKEKECSCLSRY